MAAIDPALLRDQWLQYQQSQLSQSAIIPQIPQYQPQYQQQYAPIQPQGEVISAESIAAIAQFINAANDASVAAAQYINLLESMAIEHKKLIEFSAAQDDLIWRFLNDRDFALQYARYSWIKDPVDDRFASDLADVYLEIAALSPYQQSQQPKNPRYESGSPPTFDAQLINGKLTPINPPAQNSIPPLPNSGGNVGISNNGITMEQYLIAHQNGQAGQARAAAMQNSAALYASLFQ